MRHDDATYRAQLDPLVGRRDLAESLATAAVAHRRMEERLRDRLVGTWPNLEFQFPHLALAPAAYVQRNVFSTLFLAVLVALGLADGIDLARRGAHDIGMALQVLDDVADEALQAEDDLSGFERLPQVGLPVDTAAGERLVTSLFHLRGIGHLWAFHKRTRRDIAEGAATHASAEEA